MRRLSTAWVMLWMAVYSGFAGEDDATVWGGAGKDKTAQETGKSNDQLDPIKLPPGTVVIVSPSVRDALQKAEGVLLSREEYAKLLAAVEASRKQPAEKASTPTECRLTARVEQRASQSVVRMQVVFDYRVERIPSLIQLGCGKGRIISASLDEGRLPILLGDEVNGLSLLADQPGTHKLTLDLELPLVNRTTGGNERGFELDLPGAPITTLTFDPPAGVTKLRLNKRDTVPVSRFRPGESGAALGMIKLLDLSWEGQAVQAQPEPFAQAKLDLRVNVAADETTTLSGFLTLEIQQSKRKTWELYLPAGMRVESVTAVPEPGGIVRFLDQLPEVIEPSKADRPWLINLREPSSEPLRVGIAQTIRAKRLTIGPIWVKQTAQQQGTISLSAVPQLRLVYQPRPDLRRTDTDHEEGTRTTFSYAATEQLSRTAPLELTIEPVQGGVQIRQAHELRLTESGWRVATKWLVTPSRVEVDSLQVELPRVLQDVQAGPVELLDGPPTKLADVDANWSRWRLKLATPRRNKSFSVELNGLWPSDAEKGNTQILLPRQTQTKSTNSETTLSVVAPGRFEVRGAVREWENDRIGTWETSLEPSESSNSNLTLLQANTRRNAAQVDLVWKLRPSTLAVRSQLDLTIGPTQAVVQQQLSWKDNSRSRSLRLRGPESLADWLRVVQGGTLDYYGAGQWQLTADQPTEANSDLSVTLAYAFAVDAEPTAPLNVPLIWPESTASCQTRINIWNQSPRTGPVESIAGPWQRLAISPVPEHLVLPALSLAATGTGHRLVLNRPDLANLTLSRALLERGLAQAALADAGLEIYRVRYALRPTCALPLDFDLPAALASLNLEVFVDGKRLSSLQPLVEPGESGRTVRVPIEPVPDRLSLIEFRYQIAGPALGRVTFALPRPRHVTVTGPIRWQIALPKSLVPLSLNDQIIWEDQIRWRKGLELTAAVSSAELDRWFMQGLQPGTETTNDPVASDSSLTGHTLTLNDVTLLLVARSAWLPALALTVLALGVLLALGIRKRPLLTLSLATPFVVVAVLLGMTWQQAMRQAIVAGLPGLLLLGLLGLLVVLSRLHRKRRRRLPGFARISANSSSLTRMPSRQVVRDLTTTSEVPAGQARSSVEGNR